MGTEYNPMEGIEQINEGRANQSIIYESSRLTPLLVALSAVALLISGLALGVGWWSTESYSRDYKELERENRLLQLKVDDMRVALNSQGIATNKHAASESP